MIKGISSHPIIYAPVSIGELVDKITILEIKKDFLKGNKSNNVKYELDNLREILNQCNFIVDKEFFIKLKNINQKLWEIEDLLRIKEIKQTFDKDFIDLARSVYKENDLRFLVKQEINTKYGSKIIEEKGYSFNE